MKTVILKGQEITIGSEVRFVDDRDMYADVPSINKPVVGNVYVVKEFSKNNGFLLEGIDNKVHKFSNLEGELIDICEPGFAVNRFEPAKPLRKRKIVRIEILPIVEERLYVPQKKTKSKEKVKEEELELA
jgi:hypothetical protein